ncbi:hypothetical protein GCM10010495_49010 [Kitasatospora herbaricolor]|uniref:hypothetical protein n=1 Tax=Kitasatospora herbaricolor TaxID=68217 RepID=UPI001748A7CA|nr:hypothetical protein [Kitasatospora herbaricolor]MDQ0305731.1 hypothetical protein [Kitasatospora herbaricolor]GGV27127.1 hypothetical protein GCM10010495_49010 [Kitasatospora herbaricolor]
MALSDGQLSSLADFATARAERLRSGPVSIEAMRWHVDAGDAVLLGDFPGALVRFVQRWWRAGEGWWEPLEEAAGAALDEQARRWALSQQAVFTQQGPGLQERE